MTPEELYTAVADLFAADTDARLRQLLATVVAEWPSIHGRTTTHDAETCRLAALAAVKTGDHANGPLWRARALSRYAATGWVEGIATLIMGESLIELARANDDYPDGQFLEVLRPAPAAIGILDEIAPFASGEGSGISISRNSPSPALIARFFHEKRGFFLLVQGDTEAALESYRRALDVVGASVRGQFKVRLGIALTEYVAARDRGEPTDGAATAALVAEADQAADIGLTDLINVGRYNVDQMNAGSKRLKPYEIL